MPFLVSCITSIHLLYLSITCFFIYFYSYYNKLLFYFKISYMRRNPRYLLKYFTVSFP
jgi:hypothetical protein